MFNLFNKKANQFTEPNKDIKSNEQIVTVAEIHEEFDTAVDRLLQEAKQIIGDGSVAKKAERMMKAGFQQAKGVKEGRELVNKEREMNAALYYQQHYPFNKFITLEEVKRICNKYNLYITEPYRYIGEIPDKNLKEIEDFVLRREDRQYYTTRRVLQDGQTNSQTGFTSFNGTAGSMSQGYTNLTFNQTIKYKDDPTFDIHTIPPELMICATSNLIDMTRAKKDGRMIVQDDPIVLCKLRENGCYLIVTKWGAEGKDESLTNEKSN